MITVGGKSGAGKGTLTKRLSEELGYEIISIGNIKRKLATEMGLTILEFDKIGREDPKKAQEYDLKYEEYQESLNPKDPIILDSRLSFMCQPEAFNVFLDVQDDEAAKRIFAQQREDDASKNYETVLKANTTRNQGHYDAYMKLYNIDLFDTSNYDLVVDTTNLTPDQVFDTVLNTFTTRKKQ